MRLLPLFLSAAIAFPALAQVPVEDRSRPSGSSQARPASPVPAPQPAAGPNTFSRMQMLQDEVMELRGLVEQLSNEVRLLKQRQADDYMELDRRISSSVSGAAARPATQPATPAPLKPAPAASQTTPSPSSGGYEVNRYSAAYGLLKDGKIPEATEALQQHISDFPNGKYTANAYYWLGEIYLLENKLSQARTAFSKVVDNYPAHRKAPDATFKLGKVLHMLGDNAAAEAMLNQAVDGGGSVGTLAKKYLADNF